MLLDAGGYDADSGLTLTVRTDEGTPTTVATASETGGDGNYLASWTSVDKWGFWYVGAAKKTEWGRIWLGDQANWSGSMIVVTEITGSIVSASSSVTAPTVQGSNLIGSSVSSSGNLFGSKLILGQQTITAGEIVLYDLDVYSGSLRTSVSSMTANRVWRLPDADGTLFLQGGAFTASTVSASGAITASACILGGSSTIVGAFGVATVQISRSVNGTCLITRDSNDNGGPTWEFLKRRTVGFGVIQNGDRLGTFGFSGADGTASAIGAQFWAEVTGTPSSGVMPTDIVFATGTTSPAEKMRLDKNGVLTVKNGSATQAQVARWRGTSTTDPANAVEGDFYWNSSSGVMKVYAASSWRAFVMA